MNEKVLSFIWFNRLYNQADLVTTKGEKIDIIKTGFQNRDSGPDITDAQIRIGNIVWAGNIELHVKSSHWQLHHHQNNPAYSNIILHVVFYDDNPLVDRYGNAVPTLVLPFESKYADVYNHLISDLNNEICRCGFKSFGPLKTSSFLDRLATERIVDKSQAVLETLNRNKGNWTETFWQHLARAFGFGKNSMPFQLLAQSVSFTLLQRNRHSLDIVMAILYGQAGFFQLERFATPQYDKIRRMYEYQQLKYSLTPIDPSAWKFSGMRPVNFPNRRLQQLALLAVQNGSIFSTITDTQNIDTVQDIFTFSNKDIKCNVLPSFIVSPLGNDTVNLLIINLVVPFIYAYSTLYNNDEMAQTAVSFLEKHPPEKNSVVTKMSHQATVPSSAFESQALLHLYNNYCKPKRCIECQLGRYVVRNAAR